MHAAAQPGHNTSGGTAHSALDLKLLAAQAMADGDAPRAAHLLTTAIKACGTSSGSGGADGGGCSGGGGGREGNGSAPCLRAVLYCNRSAVHTADGAYTQV